MYAWSQRSTTSPRRTAWSPCSAASSQNLGPISLSNPEYATTIAIEDLPSSYQDSLKQGIEVDDRAAADARVAELRLQAQACRWAQLNGEVCRTVPSTWTVPTPTPSPARRPPPARHAVHAGHPDIRHRGAHRPAGPGPRGDELTGDLMSIVSSFTARRRAATSSWPSSSARWPSCCSPTSTSSSRPPAPIPPGTLTLVGGYLALAIGFHLVLRWRASYADPLMLPIITLLNGLGLVMIHRIDIAHGKSIADGVALRQLMWTAVAMVIAAIVLVVLRDHRVLRRYTYLAGAIGFGLLLLPLLPVIGTSIYGSRIWIQIGPFSFQPGEIAKIALAIFFAGYLVQTRDALSVAGRKVLGLTLPRARDLGPILVAWLASLAVLIFERDLGSSLLFFGLFVAMLYVATERVSWIAIGLTLFCVGAYVAYLAFGHVQTRVLLWLDTFSPEALQASDQLAKGLMGMASGGMFGTGPGPRAPRPHLLRRVRLHHPELRRGDRADRPVRDPHALRPARAARPAHLARHPRRLRQAARRRPVLLHGAAVLRRRRRRHPGHPAHRPDDAVPVLRRLLAPRELDPGRHPAAHLRPRPAPAARGERARAPSRRPAPRW